MWSRKQRMMIHYGDMFQRCVVMMAKWMGSNGYMNASKNSGTAKKLIITKKVQIMKQKTKKMWENEMTMKMSRSWVNNRSMKLYSTVTWKDSCVIFLRKRLEGGEIEHNRKHFISCGHLLFKVLKKCQNKQIMIRITRLVCWGTLYMKTRSLAWYLEKDNL